MAKHQKDKGYQANQYDKVWRENMQAALPGIIEKVLKINVVESHDLPDKILITKEREVDVLRHVLDATGKRFILHIEVQTKNEPDMVYRMAEYRIMIQRHYKLSVRQYVIYIGKGLAKMVSVLNEDDLHFRYNLINLSQISYKLFLSSNQPEERLLAVLGDFDNEEPEHVLSVIIQKVKQSAKGDFSENRYIQQLRILVQLRNLAKHFDHAMEKVSTFFKEERDPFFQRGVKKGLEQGIEKGIAKGLERGKEQKSREFVRNLIVNFEFSDEQAASAAGVSPEFVSEIRTSLPKK